MRTELFEELKYSVKNWWMSLILGVIFVGFAILLMFTPMESYVALSMVFSACMFACGIFEIAFSVSNKNNLPGWGWYLAGGIVDLLLGLFLITYPGVSMAVIPMILAFWLMFRGFSLVGFSFDLHRYGSKNWGWYLVFGILTFLCSIAVIWQPAAGALSIVYVISFVSLFIGIARIMLAFDLKKLHEDSAELKKKIDAYQKGIQQQYK